MNPFDTIGTTRLSTSIHDRFCRLALDYQDEPAERAITALRTLADARLIADAVAVTRATRVHRDVRQGASVRGAIDVALVARELFGLRGDDGYRETLLDAMIVGLSGRITLDEAAETTPEAVLRQIWEDRFTLEPASAAPG
jgi:MoxR-like ATPase